MIALDELANEFEQLLILSGLKPSTAKYYKSKAMRTVDLCGGLESFLDIPINEIPPISENKAYCRKCLAGATRFREFIAARYPDQPQALPCVDPRFVDIPSVEDLMKSERVAWGKATGLRSKMIAAIEKYGESAYTLDCEVIVFGLCPREPWDHKSKHGTRGLIRRAVNLLQKLKRSGLLECREIPQKWAGDPLLAQYHQYLQREDRLPGATATIYTVTLANVQKTTGLSPLELISCDVDSTIAHAYPHRKSGCLNRERVALRRYQDFRKSNYSEIPESSGVST